MTDALPADLMSDLALARPDRSGADGQLRLESGDIRVPVLRRWSRGVAVAVEDAVGLRGRVDIYDGTDHLCQALIVTSRDEAGERVFEFKYTTPVSDTPPVADFVRGDDGPEAATPEAPDAPG